MFLFSLLLLYLNILFCVLLVVLFFLFFFFFQAEDGIRDPLVTGVQTCALPIFGVLPILTGDIVAAHFSPLLPITHDADRAVRYGSWDLAGWTVLAGGMFLAAWSTYGFETAVCYTGEFKDPKTDTFKAIFYSGLLCVVVYTLVPFAFQGFLGLGELVKPAELDAAGNVVTPAVYTGMLAPDI